ncbi:MAG: hypothetical protein Q8K99_11470, partial [Actinomycetota bacterium]|nr:hypothetical protein [Actinomycetota bacterium]
MRASSAWRLRRTLLHRVLSAVLALLISSVPNTVAAVAFAAEVVSVEVVAGTEHGVIRIGAGASTAFPIKVSAIGKLTKSFTESVPAKVTIPTVYSLSAAGAASSSTPSGLLNFWGDNSNDVTWVGFPTPYTVGATLNVAAGCPAGTYTLVITPTITPAQPTGNPLENAVVDSITVVVGDTTPPVTTASVSGTLGSSGWYTSNVSIALSATDNSGGTGVDYTEYSLDAGVSWTRGNSVSLTQEGVRTIYYRSVDKAVPANVESPAKQLTIKIDKTAPSISFTNLTSGDCVRSVAPEVSYSDTISSIEVGTFAMILDGLPYFGGTIVEEGLHTLTASVSDQAGNKASRSVSFRVDSTDPIVTITNPSDDGKYKSAQSFEFSVVDADPGVIVTSNPALPHIWTTEGFHTAMASATDGAGNTGSDAVSFMIDMTAPDTGADLSGLFGESGWFVGPVTVSLNADDPESGGVFSGVAETWIKVDSGDFVPYDFDSPVTVSGEGEHTVSFYSVDAAGNEEPADSTTFSIDTVKPTAGITLTGTPGLDGWYTSTVLAELSGGDDTSKLDHIEYNLNGHGWLDYEEALTLSDGKHTLQARSFDIAGNESDTAEQTVLVDTVKPTAGITLTGTPGLDGWYTSTVLAELSGLDGTSGLDRVEYDLGSGWLDYEEALTLPDGEHTLSARSVDEAGNIGAVVTETVNVDTVAPVTTCAADRVPGHNGWYTDPVTLTLGATDSGSGVAKTFYSFTGPDDW